MAEVTITEVTRVPAREEARRGKYDRIVFYAVGNAPVRFVRVPDEGFSEQAALAAIKKDLAEVGAIKGKTYQL
jgi:hypothetical protein